MRLDRVRVGDVVKVDVMGRVCFAIVVGKAKDGKLPIEPLVRGFTWRHVTGLQVKEVYRRLRT